MYLLHVDMRKGIIIGIIAVIIVSGIIAISLSDTQTDNESSLDIIEELSPEQIVSESGNNGRDLSVELTEDFGLSSEP